MASGTGNTLRGLWGSAPNDVWAVGDSTGLHWNGTAWSSVSGVAGNGVWGSGANDVWAVAANQIVHWDGTRWQSAFTPSAQINGIWGIPPNDVWAVRVHNVSGPRFRSFRRKGRQRRSALHSYRSAPYASRTPKRPRRPIGR